VSEEEKTHTAELVPPGDDLEAPLPELDNFSYSISDVMTHRKETEWVVDRMLPRGGLIVVAGLPKRSRKSLFVMALMLEVITKDGSFLGRKTEHGGVFLCNLEDGVRRIANRLFHYGVRQATLRQDFAHEARVVVKPHAMVEVEDYLRRCPPEKRPRLLIIDPLVELELEGGVINENDAGEIARLLRGWRTLAQDIDIAIAVIHHFRKAGDTMRGSSALEGACDGWWELRHQKNKPHLLSWVVRDADPGYVPVDINYENDIVSVKVAGDVQEGEPEQQPTSKRAENLSMAKEKACKILQESSVPLTQKALRSEVGCGDKVIRDIISELIEDGLVARQTTGSERGLMWTEESEQNRVPELG